MGSPATLAIRIISDAKGAVQGLDQTSARMEKVRKASSIAGKAFVAGVGLAAVAGAKFAQAAADDAKGAQLLATQMKNSAGATSSQIAATEKWISAQGRSKGVADDELRPALSTLVRVTHDVGKAQRLASLAMDVSAGSGKSLSSVSAALAKAQTGSFTGLAKLGVKTKDAAGHTRTLAAITRDLAKTYAGAASKAAETTAGKQAKLRVRMDELQESIGYGLLPVLEKVTSAGLKVVDWIDRNRKSAGILLGVLAGVTAAVAAVNVVTKLTEAYTKGAELAVKAWSLATKAAAAAQWLFNVAMEANPIGLVIVAVVALVAAIVIAYKKSATFRKIVQAVGHACAAAFGWIVDKVKELVAWVKDKAPKAWNAMKNTAIRVFKILTTPQRLMIKFMVALYGWLKDKLPKAWTWLKDKAVAVFRILTTPQRKILEWAAKAVEWVKSKIPAAFAWLKDKASDVLSKVGGFFNKLLTPVRAVRDAIQSVIGWLGKLHFPSLPGWLKDGVGFVTSAGSSASSRPSTVVVPPKATSSAAMSGGGVTYVTLNVDASFSDPEAVARKINEVMQRHARRQGRHVVSAWS